MSALLGTHDCREIERRIQAGDERAALVYKAQALQIAKGVGTLLGCFTELIDAVILTGGLAYSKMLTDMVIGYLHNLARVVVIPGEMRSEPWPWAACGCSAGRKRPKFFINQSPLTDRMIRTASIVEPGCRTIGIRLHFLRISPPISISHQAGTPRKIRWFSASFQLRSVL